MKSITKASRINAATRVVQHMNNYVAVGEACREVGTPRDFAEMKSLFPPPRCGGTS